jgi:GNAT superfamily N-acetyltransferase
MLGLQVLALAEEHLGDVARLLADRHHRHCQAQPRLSARFTDPDVTQPEVSAAAGVPEASGAVATRGGRLVGYLLGAPKPNPVWGPNVWVESVGQALAADETAETMRDLYAAAATRWVMEGRTAHYVITPAHDQPLRDAWFQLGFGHQQTHAVRDPLQHPTQPPEGISVRLARREDIPALARLEIALPQAQALAPCFSSGGIPALEEVRAEWQADFDDPDFTTFVADTNGTVIGSAIGCPLTKSSTNNGLIRPEDAAFLGFAAVFPHARGRGAGRALGEAVLSWAATAGYPVVATDWRQTNLLSSRAWPALGFTPTFIRLHRSIGY